MKTMKKIASLLLALAMIFALATTAFAEGDDDENTPPTKYDSITVNNAKAGETYKLSYYVKVEQGGAYGSEDAKPEVMLVDLAESDSSNLYKSAHYAVQLNDGWEYTGRKKVK